MVKIAHLDATNRVINISIGDSAPEPGATNAAGHALVLAGNAAIGDEYADGEFTTPPPPPPSEQEIIDAVQAHLDGVAQQQGYDSILAACSYASVDGPWQAEGVAFAAWRNACWQAAFSRMETPVATVSQVIDALPGLQ